MSDKADLQNALPAPAAVGGLQPSFLNGAIHTSVSVIALAAGLTLSVLGGVFGYVAGQLLLAFFFVHGFILLHEAGHDTLYPSRRLNRLTGHVAGFLTLIPFWNWQRIHARHHHYAGWQDLDATTASLVPRPISAWERRLINIAWASWLPLFAVIYRIQNFWNLPRVGRYIRNAANMRRIRINTWMVLAGYVVALVWAGPLTVLQVVGPAFVLSLAFQEALILSQHTHVPQRLSDGEKVRPFAPIEQARFTRSLRLPDWLSSLLLHFDAHELHHMYPFVPGYLLRRIDFQPEHEVNWWQWLKSAHSLTGTDFLFSNWDDTGVRI